MDARRRRALALAGALAVARVASGQGLDEDLDTPFVITPTNVVTAMLDLARVAPGERLVDLGSGDGRIVVAAAQRGAIALGIEIDERLVERSRETARRLRLADRATFVTQDLFETDLSSANVVTLYLLPDVNRRLAPRFLATLAPGTRIVSHDYGLGAWPPDASIVVDAPDKPVNVEKKSRLFYWVVPAQLAGRWTDGASNGAVSLDIAQQYQRVSGSLRLAGREFAFADRSIDGDRLALALSSPAGTIDLTLRVRGATLTGELREPGRAPLPITLSR
jgi:SAM-dependent methyltransferase